jgi:hypothetical protein
MNENQVIVTPKRINQINIQNKIENGKIDLAKQIIADTIGINIQDVLSLEPVGKESRKVELTKKAILCFFQTEQNEEMKTLTADIREICNNIINKAEINNVSTFEDFAKTIEEMKKNPKMNQEIVYRMPYKSVYSKKNISLSIFKEG